MGPTATSAARSEAAPFNPVVSLRLAADQRPVSAARSNDHSPLSRGAHPRKRTHHVSRPPPNHQDRTPGTAAPRRAHPTVDGQPGPIPQKSSHRSRRPGTGRKRRHPGSRGSRAILGAGTVEPSAGGRQRPASRFDGRTTDRRRASAVASAVASAGDGFGSGCCSTRAGRRYRIQPKVGNRKPVTERSCYQGPCRPSSGSSGGRRCSSSAVAPEPDRAARGTAHQGTSSRRGQWR